MPVKYNVKFTTTVKQQIARRLSEYTRNVSKELTQLAAETIQASVKDEIPPPKKGRWRARASLPDPEGTGALKAAVKMTAPTPIGGSQYAHRARVYVDTSGDVGKYALIHEIGGTIMSHAGGPAMRFPYPPNSDQIISRRSVRIRAKWYFRDGSKDGVAEFRRIAANIVFDPRLRGSKYRSRSTGQIIKFPG